MKTFFALTAIVAAFSLAQGSEPAWCRCATFVSSRHNEIMVMELPQTDIDTCDSHNQCKNRCTTEISDMTNDLDLWSTVNGDTVGQFFCTELQSHYFFWIHNSYVHGYYQMCGGPWEYTGQDSQQMLCCANGQHEHCVTK